MDNRFQVPDYFKDYLLRLSFIPYHTYYPSFKIKGESSKTTEDI